MFYCPGGGAEEFNPGFQPWEPSSKPIRPHKEHGGITCDVGPNKSARLTGPYRAKRLLMFTQAKAWAEIGVGTNLVFAPPSEPDWQISCIRLSSWWLAFKKIGVPQCALVLRRTSPPRRSRYLAIGSDLFLWPGLFASSGA